MYIIRRVNSCDRRPLIGSSVLISLAGTVMALLFLHSSFANLPDSARMFATPDRVTVNEGVFTLTVMAESHVPVNTFAGELHFDPAIVSVDEINYRSSVANLWVTAPSYDNASGSIRFVGGTTQAGGFTGSGALFTVTFRTRMSGVTTIGFTKGEMLQNDGQGTSVELDMLDDSVVTIESNMIVQDSLLSHTDPSAEDEESADHPTPQGFDLNGDGEHSFGDAGVFMEFMASNDTAADFDKDGAVTEKDFDMLLTRIDH